MEKIKAFFKKVFSKESLKKFYRTYIWLMVLLFVIDIVTKWVVLNHYGIDAMIEGRRSDSGAIPVIKNFCYIGGSINNGAAFSLLAGRRVPLLIISLVMTGAFIAYYIVQYKKLTTVYRVALALMIAGGFGNLIDRAFYWPSTTGFDGVIDWIIFKFGSWEFAMFNIADSCLVIGIIVIIVAIIVEEAKEVKAKAKRGEYKYSPEELEKMEKEKQAQENKENEGNKGE